MSEAAAVRDFYRDFAQRYDGDRFARPYDRAVSARETAFVRRAAAGAATAVEVGCGTGRLTSAIAPAVGSLVAVDVAPEMLALASRRVDGHPGVSFVCADVHDLPRVLSLRADLLVCLRVLPHLEDRRRALAALAELVRPGGSVVFDLWNDRSFVGGARRLARRPSRVPTYFDRYAEMLATVRAAGLVIEDQMAWGFPRVGGRSLDRVGQRIAPALAYSVVFRARR